MKTFFVITKWCALFIIIVGLAVLFSFNQQIITFNYLWSEIDLPLSVLLSVAFVSGIIFLLLFIICYVTIPNWWKKKELQERVNKLSAEKQALQSKQYENNENK